MIGDSVSVRTIPAFQETFPYGAIDAAVNRQLSVGRERVRLPTPTRTSWATWWCSRWARTDQWTTTTLDELVATVGPDKQVFFVNTRSPQSWVEGQRRARCGRGRALRQRARHRLVRRQRRPRRGLFDGDGTHLTEEGAQAYIDLVHGAVEALLPSHEENAEAAVVKSPLELATDGAQDATEQAVRAIARSAAASLAPEQTAS